ncbi:MAG: hypothetical protein AAB809_01205 [Patescibacteria group bacterium]
MKERCIKELVIYVKKMEFQYIQTALPFLFIVTNVGGVMAGMQLALG